ncbi:HCRTR2 [Mytilus coruscus]|uniref:HCRTR2 n=1 Tax=Mytilus coruscus TaxID=42192 RepID=A0A6J8BXZ9_MYTCO|nr:HCRTR2 [Mytilus coruscus]
MGSMGWFMLQEAALFRNESKIKTLSDYNKEESLRRLAPLIYLVILFITGIIGNTIVLIVYPLTFPRNTHRTFIVGLAISDLLVCLVTIPFEIIEMRFQYTFYNVVACKIFRSISYWFSLVSMIILIGSSFEKYRRICKPMQRQMTVKSCRIYIVTVFVFTLLFAWPNLLQGGIRLVKLSNNITGHDCSLSDDYAKTLFPIVSEGILLLFSIVCICFLIVIYSIIGRRIFIQSRFRKQFETHSRNTNKNYDRPSSGIVTTDGIKSINTIENSEVSEGVNTIQNRSVQKLTKIVFVISVVFVLSYIPHLTISLLTAIKGKFLLPPGPVVSAALPIIARSFIINNVANPIIYGFMDSRFRKTCKFLLFKIFHCKQT